MKKIILSQGWRLSMLEPCSDLSSILLEDVIKDAYKINKMPSQVADVLRLNGLIEDPSLPGKAEEYKWIAEKDWVYSAVFDAAELSSPISLSCRGLDLLADIYLNGKKISEHKNAFLPFETDVTDYIKPQSTNTLQIHFHSVPDWLKNIDKPEKFAKVKTINLLRKDDQNFEDYLGPHPYFIKVGVFDEIALISEGRGRLKDVILNSTLNKSMDAGQFEMCCNGSFSGKEAVIKADITNPYGKIISSEWPISDKKFSTVCKVNIDNPKLWWPRGYGDQNMYNIKVTLLVDGIEQDSVCKNTALRKLEMSKPLHFVINDKPVRMWGGNWAQLDSATLVWNQQRAEALLNLAADANFNALRIWGPGTPIPEQFYELADKMGFMLWQEFHYMPLIMDDEYRAIACSEAEYTVKRLLHHPSILLWCGGNEMKMWHEFFTPKEPFYQVEILEGDLKKVCDKLDPNRLYMPDSPYYGMEPNDPMEWDTHGYTNIWYVPGYDYLNFASEDTRICAPTLRTCRRFMSAEDLWPKDYSPVQLHGNQFPWPDSWNNYTCSISWKKTGPVEQFYDAADAEGLIHRLGMAESVYYQDTIERQRRGRSSGIDGDDRCCGGYLVWKFNDSWHEIYSAKVDYLLEPYIPYYAIKRAYAPVIVSFDMRNFIHVWVVNDSNETVEGMVRVTLFNIEKNEITDEAFFPVSIMPDKSIDVADLTYRFKAIKKENILLAQLTDKNGNILARTNAFLDIERMITFPNAELSVKVDKDELIISTNSFARTVYIEGNDNGDEFGWQFSDNYFDLVPGEVKHVKVSGRHNQGVIMLRPFYSKHVVEVKYNP